MKTFNINTTAYEEENLVITTDLTEEQIIEIISPIVEKEREEDVEYDNEMLIDALKESYPNNTIIDNTSKILIIV